MIFRTGCRANADGRRSAGFTLVELILVMVLLATVLAFAAPSLARFMGQRHIEAEAARFQALTQFGRNEAVSVGIPMLLWIDPELQEFGLEPFPGFPARDGKPLIFRVQRDLRIVIENSLTRTGNQPRIEFLPDGSIGENSLAEVILEDRGGERLYIARDEYGLSYEILREDDHARRRTSF